LEKAMKQFPNIRLFFSKLHVSGGVLSLHSASQLPLRNPSIGSFKWGARRHIIRYRLIQSPTIRNPLPKTYLCPDFQNKRQLSGKLESIPS
jgi:hypothetical protein